jgi:outer membrane murein-binding lipoprotein Lpp
MSLATKCLEHRFLMRGANLIGTLVALGTWTACGGVNQQRFDALEAQVKQLQANAPDSTAAEPVAALEERVKNLEAAEKTLRALVETVQQPQGAATGEATFADPDETDAWADAQFILGVETTPVKESGDGFSVNRRWLMRELRALAITGKVPKLAAGKKGVVIRGFRPKSMFDTLGFKNGDVIVSVNGAPVSSADDLVGALQMRQNPTTIQVERRRKPLSLTFEVAD